MSAEYSLDGCTMAECIMPPVTGLGSCLMLSTHCSIMIQQGGPRFPANLQMACTQLPIYSGGSPAEPHYSSVATNWGATWLWDPCWLFVLGCAACPSVRSSCTGVTRHRLLTLDCAQVHSFECQLPAPPCFHDAGLDTEDFRALFIRAPAVMSSAPDVEVLGKYTLTDAERAAQVRLNV